MDVDERKEREMIRQATRAAMQDVLLTLGVDVSDPTSVKEMQKDMAWVRQGRKTSDQMPIYAKKAMVWTAISAAVLYAGSLIIQSIPWK